ncbi:MAG: SH3 domain-containing protein [Clostridia bacterium]|nr:SH3 domain-containing protein [Clostridia bacterium]
MKRLISLLLIFCMLLPCVSGAEQLGDAVEDGFTAAPDELVQAPVEEEVELPEIEEGLMLLPNDGVDGPEAYRELVLLQPTDLMGTAISVSTIRLSWGPVAFATQYDVYRKELGETDYSYVTSTPSEQLFYEDTSVVPGTVYYYRVQAANVSYSEGSPVVTYSPQSNTLPFMTLKAPVVNDPRGIDDTTLRLTWGTVDGYPVYEIEMATNPEGPYTVARKDISGSYCNVENLVNGTGYYFRVRAVRVFSSGEKFYSEYSDPVKCGTPMQRPTLAVSPDGNNGVLTWSKSAGATGYVIYRKVGTAGSYQKLAITDDTTVYVDPELTPGEVYYYFVYAMAPVGDYNCFSLSSDTRFFTVVEGAVLTAVQNTGEREQTINWTGPQNADGSVNPTCAGASKYLVFSSTSIDGLYTQIGETTGTTFVATDLVEGETYYYKVRAVREFSNGDVSYGPWSNVMSMPEAGAMQINSWSATNVTLGQDIAGGYVGDVFNWAVNVSGGSGAYTFKFSLVSLQGNGTLVLQNFSEGYSVIPEGQDNLTYNFGVVLTDEMCDLITNQQYAMQIEVMDSLGAVAAQYACGDTYAEMNFCAPKPTTQTINITLRPGETLEMAHGVCPEAGDTVHLSVSNPTGAVTLNGNTITAVSNGYAAILVTPERYKNDILIVYNITVGYATLAVNSITPSANECNTSDTLSWDINYTGGRPNYTLNIKVYRGTTLVASSSKTTASSGLLSVNYQPSVAGEYTLEVTISTADAQTVTKRSAVTKVVAYNPVTVLPSATTGKTGESITWVTAYTGNDTVVRRDYTLFRDGVVVASSVGTNEFSFTYTPTVAGSYVLTVKVYESSGKTIDVTSTTVTISQGAPSGSSTGVVNGTRVAMRKGPGTSYGIYQRIERGETVYVIKEQNGWYYICYEGQYGWMMAKYVKLQ